MTNYWKQFFHYLYLLKLFIEKKQCSKSYINIIKVIFIFCGKLIICTQSQVMYIWTLSKVHTLQIDKLNISKKLAVLKKAMFGLL